MKTKISMWMLLSFLTAMLVRGEVLVSTNGEVFRLNVATGQVVAISYYMDGAGPASPWLLIANGMTNELPFYLDQKDQPKAVLPGPFELIKTNGGNRVISYQVLSGLPIFSEVVTSHSTNVLDVPSGKTIKFMPPIPRAGIQATRVSLQQGAKIVEAYIAGGEEFTGPLKFKFSFFDPQTNTNRVEMYPYLFTENAVALPELKLLQGPSGNFQIGVDRSVDLTNWVPVIIHNTSDEQQAFYRLRLTK